jgi:hypothetical protein
MLLRFGSWLEIDRSREMEFTDVDRDFDTGNGTKRSNGTAKDSVLQAGAVAGR